MKTLYERFQAFGLHMPMVHPRAITQLQAAARQAHRFVLDAAASIEIAQVIRANPEFIVREQAWARAPFERCWIELNFAKYWEVFHGNDTDEQVLHYYRQTFPEFGEPASAQAARDYCKTTGDDLVGFLVDHNRVNSVVCSRQQPNQQLAVHPIQYRLHTEWPETDMLALCKLASFSPSAFDQFLWGSSWDDIAPADRPLLRRHNTIELLPLKPRGSFSSGDIHRVFVSCVGEFRTVLGLLIMLNRPALTQFSPVAGSRGYGQRKSNGKPMARLSYTSVTVDLNAIRTLHATGATTGGMAGPRRRHEVRGHYAHNQEAHDYARDAGCVHVWRACGDNNWIPLASEPPSDYEVRHWLCDDCGGKRWLVEEHERGDTSKGRIVHQSYEVKA